MRAERAYVLDNIRQLYTLDPARASADDPLGVAADAALAVEDGLVVWAGPAADRPARLADWPRRDAHGALVTPGWIDSHAHPVFAGDRSSEYAERLAGASYLDIARRGGGIAATVRATRAASEEELFRLARHWLDEMLAWGVTTAEAKSGYGLSVDAELKQLRVIGRLAAEGAPAVVPTFMGAHDFPPEWSGDHDGYVNLVIEKMLPAVAEQGVAVFCDVFCEKGWFTVEQTRRILLAARRLGLKLRLHADEFSPSGAAELAAELGACAADHLMAVSDAGVAALARAGTVAGILPGTTLTLGLQLFAPWEKLREAGVALALASDFNPGSCFCAPLPLIAQLAAMRMKWPPAALLPAVTRDAARSLDLPDRGVLAPGRRADMVLFDAPSLDYLFYRWGRNHAQQVIVNGRVAWTHRRPPLFARD